MIGSGFNIPNEIKKTLIIGVVIFAVVLFFGGRGIYNHSITRLVKYRQERARVQLENKVGNKLGDLQKIREGMKVVKESSQFLAEIAKISGVLNMKLVSISALPMEKRGEFIKLSVQLELDTTYHQLGAFVSKLEGEDLIMIIERLEIKPPKMVTTAKAAIAAKLVVSTFYLTDTDLEK
ncbi:MAG: type 4a pilus biogenesis protein PilO [Candidatus Omnitrophota bacterium]